MTAPLTLPGPTLREGRRSLLWLLIAADAEVVAPTCDCHPDYHEVGVHAPGVVA